MLISNLNLYKAGWLDLVFENRNKEYGAYELRANNGHNTVRAMGITFFGVAVLCAASVIFSHPTTSDHTTIVTFNPSIPPVAVQPDKKVIPPVEAKLKPHPIAPKITTIKNIPPVVVVDTKADKPVVTVDIKGAIGTEDVKGKSIADNVILESKTPPGPGDGVPEPDNSIHPMGTLDVMPAPVGGNKAWANFLNKNLRFPGEAQDQGMSGKVFLSFIIEKDGHLSNIMLINKAGYGFDEEALRVLKLAKAWKPGLANGQPVRVKFTLPINFQVAEQ